MAEFEQPEGPRWISSELLHAPYRALHRLERGDLLTIYYIPLDTAINLPPENPADIPIHGRTCEMVDITKFEPQIQELAFWVIHRGADEDSLDDIRMVDSVDPSLVEEGVDVGEVPMANYRLVGGLTEQGGQLHRLMNQGLFDDGVLDYLNEPGTDFTSRDLVEDGEFCFGSDWLLDAESVDGSFRMVLPFVLGVKIERFKRGRSKEVDNSFVEAKKRYRLTRQRQLREKREETN